jgi:hypothetical protein
MPVCDVDVNVDDVRTSQGKHLWTSTACYRDGFTLCM